MMYKDRLLAIKEILQFCLLLGIINPKATL